MKLKFVAKEIFSGGGGLADFIAGVSTPFRREGEKKTRRSGGLRGSGKWSNMR